MSRHCAPLLSSVWMVRASTMSGAPCGPVARRRCMVLLVLLRRLPRVGAGLSGVMFRV